MTKRVLAQVRPSAIAYVLIGMLIAGGGTYALAGPGTKTISVCASKKTGVLHLKTHGACGRSQTRVSWNQSGPPGPTGKRGARGLPGTPAVNAWAIVQSDGTLLKGNNVTVTRNSPGSYSVKITGPCRGKVNVPTVTAIGNEPANSEPPVQLPVAWLWGIGGGEFAVYTGLDVNGAYTAADFDFSLIDTCGKGSK